MSRFNHFPAVSSLKNALGRVNWPCQSFHPWVLVRLVIEIVQFGIEFWTCEIRVLVLMSWNWVGKPTSITKLGCQQSMFWPNLVKHQIGFSNLNWVCCQHVGPCVWCYDCVQAYFQCVEVHQSFFGHVKVHVSTPCCRWGMCIHVLTHHNFFWCVSMREGVFWYMLARHYVFPVHNIVVL